MPKLKKLVNFFSNPFEEHITKGIGRIHGHIKNCEIKCSIRD